MIKKILFALLSSMVGLFGAVFASTGTMTTSQNGLSLKALNLPVAFSGYFDLQLEVKTDNDIFSGEKLNLSFEQCGEDGAEIFYENSKKENLISDFYLNKTEKKNFTIGIKKGITTNCQIDFLISSGDNTAALAKTSIVLKAGCGDFIDHDEDKILADINSMKEEIKSEGNQSIKTIKIQKNNKNNKEDTTIEATKELEETLDRAIQKGLLTDSQEMREGFNKPMTRLQLAQMIISLSDHLALATNDKKDCSFLDLKTTPESTQSTAKRVCQLNIMGIYPDQSALENFMPDQIVDRAQMATVLSRLIRKDSFNAGGQTFYEKHIEKLKSEQLISNGTPDSVEIQGYFYLILKRAEKNKIINFEKKEEKKVGFFDTLF